ncbi:MAG: DUF2974 domain-containing protein [Eubacterium sp.]|nr:DUF2974 domain-containing protein [Eubacterium sp.]
MSKAAKNDELMMIATQVAYLNCAEGKTVKQNIDSIINSYKNNPHPTAADTAQYNTAVNLRERLQNDNLSQCNDWVVRETCDCNNQNGFYGCLIDTNDGDAILGFRGSESYDSTQNVNDWVKADFGLLNNSLTAQQKEAEDFTNFIYEKYGDRYNSYNFSGHSLGGNLAEHSTINAPNGMHVGRCTSWDGPGFSDEYIATHLDKINKRANNIDHYQWSIIGTMLIPIPGTNYKTIAAHNGDGLAGVFMRHDTRNIDFDANGNVVYENITNMKFDDYISRLAEFLGGRISKELELTIPLLLPIAILYQYADDVFGFLSEAFTTAVEEVKKKLNEISKSISNWFQRTFGFGTNGEFEIQINAVSNATEELNRISQRINNIGSEVVSISNSLPYQSFLGSYYKSRIKGIGNSIINYGNKGRNLMNTTRNVLQRAQRADATVAENFAACALSK